MQQPTSEHMYPDYADDAMPIPDRDSLDEREQAALDYILPRLERMFTSVPALRDAGKGKRIPPFYQGLLQSPRVAELWAHFGDFFQTTENRGGFTSRDRELADVVLNHELGKRLGGIHIADAVGAGLAALDIRAILDDRLDDIAPEDRRLVEYIQATARGTLTQDRFEWLAGRMGSVKTAIEYTSYVTYCIGRLRTVQAMWGLLGQDLEYSGSDELIQMYIDGTAIPHDPHRGGVWVEDENA